MRFLKKTLAAVMSVVLSVTLFSGTVVFAAAPTLEGYNVKAATDSAYSTVLGKSIVKTYGGQQSNVYTYGASGFTANFVGTEFWMYVPELPEWDNAYRAQDVMVLVDTDMPMEATKIKVSQPGWVCLASNLEENVPHTIKMFKMSRGFYGFMASEWLPVSHIATDGEYLTPDPVSDLVIEVYGDSISNGDAIWLNEDGSNSAYTYGSYSSIVSRLLGGEIRVTANTGNGLIGWCLANSSNLELENLLPPQNCWNRFDSQFDGNISWDHSGDNAADVVIINLGTNDNADFGIDGSRKAYADEYVRFIKQIKTDCPDAIVICALGAMGAIDTWGPCIWGDGSDYYAYSYTRLTKNGNSVASKTVTGYVEASRKNAFIAQVEEHTATPTGNNGAYTVADIDAVDKNVVVAKNSLQIDAEPSHDDNIVNQCNEWAGEEFCFFTELAHCSTISGGLGYDNGHPSNVAQEVYGLQIAKIINDKLDLGVDLTGKEETKPSNINLDQNYFSSSEYNSDHATAKAFDTLESTSWQAQQNTANGAFIQVNYDNEYTISKVVVDFEESYPTGTTKIEYSLDGANWKVFKTFEATEVTSYTLVATPVKARYLKMTFSGTSNGKNYPAKVREFEAYESDEEGDAEVSYTVAQKSSNDDGKRVRLMAAVEGLDYKKVGFEITVKDDEHEETNVTTWEDTEVYDSIAGITSADLGIDNGYMFALTVNEMPNNTVLSVRAYAVDMNGNRIYGNDEIATTVTLVNGVLSVVN